MSPLRLPRTLILSDLHLGRPGGAGEGRAREGDDEVLASVLAVLHGLSVLLDGVSPRARVRHCPLRMAAPSRFGTGRQTYDRAASVR